MNTVSRRQWLLLAAAAPLLPAAQAATAPPEVQTALPGATLQGQGRLRFFGLHVYDIRLWAPAGFVPDRWAQTPLALEIEYARTLYGRQIAERSLDEMKRQGEIAADTGSRWLAEMNRLFPDVKQGDRITGVKQPGVSASFFMNGQTRGELRDGDFARRFFGIWLAPQTSEPALRERLFGRQP
jgi:hypothetical protein